MITHTDTDYFTPIPKSRVSQSGLLLTSIHDVCKRGSLEDLKEWLLQYPENLEAVDLLGRTALSEVIRLRHGKEWVSFLIKQGADIRSTDALGRRALHYAIMVCHVEPFDDTLLKILLTAEKDLSTEVEGRLPLHEAIAMHKPPCVPLLMEYGAQVNAVNNTGFTPLHAACLYAHFDTVKLLIEAGANPLKTADIGEGECVTPLELAKKFEHPEIVNYLEAVTTVYQERLDLAESAKAALGHTEESESLESRASTNRKTKAL